MASDKANWWQSGIFYQIYPRSFQDSNHDGVGDLQGILNRLPYLTELGVDAIWLSPIFTSPMADFGYDISNYTDVDPIFGDYRRPRCSHKRSPPQTAQAYSRLRA